MKKNLLISVGALSAMVLILGVYFFYFKTNKSSSFDYTNESIVFNVQVPKDFNSDRLARLTDKRQQALDLYKKDINDTWTWLVIGNYYEFAHDYIKAVLAYEHVLALDNKEAMALSNLAHIYEGQFLDYTKAEEYYQKALEVIPNNTQLYVDLANMYEFKANKPTRAVETYRAGLQSNINDPVLLVSLIKYYQRHNDIAEAKRYAQILLIAYPDQPVYQIYKALLK